MGAVVGYGVALQASCLEGFDSLGFHQLTYKEKDHGAVVVIVIMGFLYLILRKY